MQVQILFGRDTWANCPHKHTGTRQFSYLHWQLLFILNLLKFLHLDFLNYIFGFVSPPIFLPLYNLPFFRTIVSIKRILLKLLCSTVNKRNFLPLGIQINTAFLTLYNCLYYVTNYSKTAMNYNTMKWIS